MIKLALYCKANRFDSTSTSSIIACVDKPDVVGDYDATSEPHFHFISCRPSEGQR